MNVNGVEIVKLWEVKLQHMQLFSTSLHLRYIFSNRLSFLIFHVCHNFIFKFVLGYQIHCHYLSFSWCSGGSSEG